MSESTPEATLETTKQTAAARLHMDSIRANIEEARAEVAALPPYQREAYARSFDEAEAEGRCIAEGGPEGDVSPLVRFVLDSY